MGLGSDTSLPSKKHFPHANSKAHGGMLTGAWGKSFVSGRGVCVSNNLSLSATSVNHKYWHEVLVCIDLVALLFTACWQCYLSRLE